MVQTAVNYREPVSVEGLVYDNQSTLTLVNTDDIITFGRLVAYDAANKSVKVFDSSSDKIAGVSLNNRSTQAGDVDGDNGYPLESACAILQRGSVMVKVETDVDATDTVFARFAPRHELSELSFDAAFVASNTLTFDVAATIGGVTTTTEGVSIPFDTNNVTTIGNIVTSLEAIVGITNAGSTIDVSGSSVIEVEAEDNYTIVISNISVTGGSSQPDGSFEVTTEAKTSADFGLFRADSDTSTAISITGFKFLSSASAGELVELSVNLPQ